MPERIATPMEPTARAVLERVNMPLYDSIVIGDTNNQLPNQPVYFFVNPLGQAEQVTGVAGAFGTKTFLSTNMEASGALPAPRLCVVMGFSLHMNPYYAAQQNIATPNFFRGHPNCEDLKRIAYYSAFRFTVGPKDYLNVPTFLIPGNYGLRGGTAYDDSVVLDAAGLALAQIRQNWALTGRHHTCVQKPITIAPQQSFKAQLEWDTATDAFAVGGLNTPGDMDGQGRRLWLILHGEQGREVA